MHYDPRAHQTRLRGKRLTAARQKGRHTRTEWLELKRLYGFRCVRCGVKESAPYNLLQRDHVHEISQGGCDCIGNIQPLCGSCNAKKNGRKNESWDFRQIAMSKGRPFYIGE
ncbi:MAG: HNH endonuclease [Acidobacteria bacterium]|nr:HNH endonuclease [Acidobacteriota bacterium]